MNEVTDRPSRGAEGPAASGYDAAVEAHIGGGSFERIVATSADLPLAVAAALAQPAPGRRRVEEAAGIPWSSLAWGDPADRPLLLVHGVTSDSGTFWRLGPALAASGRYVVAVDLPGHGRTGSWTGRHRFAETAADLAAFLRTAGLARPGLAVLGHSWGAMVVAALPAAGLRPAVLILLDPPAQSVAGMEQMTLDPQETFFPDVATARAAIRAANPTWVEGDVDAKAEGLSRFNVKAVRAVLLDNGDWDGGLAALSAPEAAGIPTWFVRGEFETGGLIPGEALPALAARVGADHILTIALGPHSPQRTHPEATLVAILRALGA
jgi:pimeloyl-ACP methyl ester carboxylesterase